MTMTTDARRRATKMQRDCGWRRFYNLGDDLIHCVNSMIDAWELKPLSETARDFLGSLVGTESELILDSQGLLRILAPYASTDHMAGLVLRANAECLENEREYWCVEDWYGFGVVVFDLSKSDKAQSVYDYSELDGLMDDFVSMNEYPVLEDDTYLALEDEAIWEAIEGWMVDDALGLLGELHPGVDDFDRASVAEAIHEGLGVDLPYELEEVGDVYVRSDDFEEFVTALDVTELTR